MESDDMVAVHGASGMSYPQEAPFHPSTAYPEYRHRQIGRANGVYEGVRECFRLLGMDAGRFGSTEWNPLGDLIRTGDRVVLKPNLISHTHKYKPDEWSQVVTHGSVVRTVLDYVLIALSGKGQVIIADGPQQDSNWDLIMARTDLGEVVRFCAQRSPVEVRLMDLRDLYMEMEAEVVSRRLPLPGDPDGGTIIDLRDQSRLAGHGGAGRYYGADYDQAETNYHHTEGRHQYRLSRTACSADVFINLPKMKTHKKVGVTLCLKNIVGINSGRNWLPHHTDGDLSNGGDQFPTSSMEGRSERLAVRTFQRLALRHPAVFVPVFRALKKAAKPIWGDTNVVIRSGNWHGNDTAWRMVHDINRCLSYSDGLHFPTLLPKRFFAVIDGVVGGEADGPSAPDPVHAGLLIAGHNALSVDCVATALMGLDPLSIPMLARAFDPHPMPLVRCGYSDIRVVSNSPKWNRALVEIEAQDCLQFAPHMGWRGFIERKSGPLRSAHPEKSD